MSTLKQTRQWTMPPEDVRCMFYGPPYHDNQARPIPSPNAWMPDWVIVMGDKILYYECKSVPQSSVSGQSHETSPALLPPADSALNEMSGWMQNWNGRGFEAPRTEAIRNARTHVRIFRNVAKIAEIRWCEPHVTSSPDGEVVFEWWHGEKKLTIYFQEDSAEYVKVWGPNVHSEMEDGDLGNFLPLLQWLTT